MAKKAIKTDLFRFVTLRTPQLINEQRKDIGFIFHPDTTQSSFLKDVAENTSVEDARSLVLTAAGEFNGAFETYLKVKLVSTDLYNFSSWLMNNRNSLTETEVAAKTAGLTVLDSNSELKLWDNLHYQVIKKKSSYVRQACIQMIVANNFLKKFADYDDAVIKITEEEYLVRLANAKVIIDKAFTKQSEETDACCVNLDGVGNKIGKKADNYLAQKTIDVLEEAKEELSQIDLTYQKSYQEAYDAAYEIYQTNVEKLAREAEKTQILKQREENKLALIENRTPEEIRIEVELPKFDFTYASPFTSQTKSVNTETQNVIAALKLDKSESIGHAIEKLDEEIKKERKIIFDNTEAAKKAIVVNGVKLSAQNYDLLSPNCYMVHTKNERSFPLVFPLKTAVILTVNLGSTTKHIVSENHKIIYGGVTETSSNSFVIHDNEIGDGIVGLRLFSDKVLQINSSFYDLSGELTLNDGTVLEYNVRVYQSKGYAHGCFEVKDDSGDGDNGNTPVSVNLYGVGKIGVADFRKVEQEVCCYVPGEVSHIENILAREYKERSTRNLTSVETTTETTSEREVENLTDTTTTERNELSSEVSSVMNEDQSQAYGASAGVNGKFPSGSYNINGYADFANSSSSSQSNSSAQTYAKEITERALDRIVQKTTKKRSSRILKEFEENNKHGFDNREGNEHVSGVYRWIDIIYKNQLVNYGKRLMYEFMVPEPSKFFKDAILKGVNEDASGSQVFALEEPIHPSELPNGLALTSPGQLHKNNYQAIAAFYNAEIAAIPDQYRFVGTSLTKSQQGGDGSNKNNKAPSKTIEVPKGYKGISAKTSGKSNGFAQVTVGGLNMGVNSYNFINIHPNYLDDIPVSGYFEWNWITNINIVVKCERTEEHYQQWQNDVFKAILDAYAERMQEFKEAQAASGIDNVQDTEKVRFNPLFNRAIEKRELKRICIEMLARPYGNPLDKNNYTEDANNLPLVAQNAEFENHAAHVKFFEQAFDWEIMAYLFYPYYWADRKDWKDLYQQTDAADPIFQAFLQSGMARTVVPVRPGFEDAVAYYMETGDIWNGGDLVVDHEDDLYVSIAEEMQTVEGEVEEQWESRMPTSLTMIQKDTIGLEETGLPCCDFVLNADGGGDYTNPIQPKTSLIGGESTSSETTSGATKTILEDPVLTTKS